MLVSGLKTTTASLLAICFMVLGASAAALAAPTYDPEKNADEQMGFWDTDADQVVTLEEFTRSRAGRFQQIDSDANGFTTLQEWLEFRPAKKIVVINMMKRWDSNADNVVSRDEFLQPKTKEFEQIDTNHDAGISRQELVEHWTRKKQELDNYWESDSD